MPRSGRSEGPGKNLIYYAEYVCLFIVYKHFKQIKQIKQINIYQPSG